MFYKHPPTIVLWKQFKQFDKLCLRWNLVWVKLLIKTYNFFLKKTTKQDYFMILPSIFLIFNPLSANLTKWSNTLKQFVGKLPTNCLSVFDHFVGLALKGLSSLFFQNTSRGIFLKNLSFIHLSLMFGNGSTMIQIRHACVARVLLVPI